MMTFDVVMTVVTSVLSYRSPRSPWPSASAKPTNMRPDAAAADAVDAPGAAVAATGSDDSGDGGDGDGDADADAVFDGGGESAAKSSSATKDDENCTPWEHGSLPCEMPKTGVPASSS